MKYLLTLLILVPALAWSAPQKQGVQRRASAPKASPKKSTSFNGFRVTVVFGQQKSHFTVWQDQRGKFYAVSKGGQPTIGTLTDTNFSFFNTQSREIASLKGNNVQSCPRANIQLYQGNKFVQASCIGLKNSTSARMTQLANMLATLQ
ncbi:hypothetical protein B9G69_017205 [Bdellovibrio sp. SKB1291214]|uniref:hypothetical protein n=1 Tax=Bdellovibrio sp. SKB1291214 TaxID=1732569 RepID=UPI000B515AC9|nr:hypothetical protein [Bdellovibrio sp. SKB1291214]UYL08783.1 hypothetical protein B9G69_017205 [Bdellovibrio sp. SKB1291214]